MVKHHIETNRQCKDLHIQQAVVIIKKHIMKLVQIYLDWNMYLFIQFTATNGIHDSLFLLREWTLGEVQITDADCNNKNMNNITLTMRRAGSCKAIELSLVSVCVCVCNNTSSEQAHYPGDRQAKQRETERERQRIASHCATHSTFTWESMQQNTFIMLFLETQLA